MAKPADGHDNEGQVDFSAYGNGPVGVSVQGFKTPIDDTIIQGAKDMGGRFSYVQDFGTGNAQGGIGEQFNRTRRPTRLTSWIGYVPVTIANNTRSSSYTAYIKPIVSTRTNLDVLINTRAQKLIQSGTVDSIPEFKVVEVAQSKGGMYSG